MGPPQGAGLNADSEARCCRRIAVPSAGCHGLVAAPRMQKIKDQPRFKHLCKPFTRRKPLAPLRGRAPEGEVGVAPGSSKQEGPFIQSPHPLNTPAAAAAAATTSRRRRRRSWTAHSLTAWCLTRRCLTWRAWTGRQMASYSSYSALRHPWCAGQYAMMISVSCLLNGGPPISWAPMSA